MHCSILQIFAIEILWNNLQSPRYTLFRLQLLHNLHRFGGHFVHITQFNVIEIVDRYRGSCCTMWWWWWWWWWGNRWDVIVAVQWFKCLGLDDAIMRCKASDNCLDQSQSTPLRRGGGVVRQLDGEGTHRADCPPSYNVVEYLGNIPSSWWNMYAPRIHLKWYFMSIRGIRHCP